MSVGQVGRPMSRESGWTRRHRSRAWTRGLVAALLFAACTVGGQALAQRPVAAAPPTDIVLATGMNSSRQLGDGTTTNRLVPVRPLLPEGVTVTQVSAGIYHSLALTSDGRVLAWGSNDYGRLGDGTTTPRTTYVWVRLPAGVTITQVSAGHDHNLAVASDGRVFAWGRNTEGQVGDGTTTMRPTPVQVHLPAGVTASQVSAGSVNSLAVTSDGQALSWGMNAGRLGDGTTTNRSTPVYVHLPPDVTVTQVSAGHDHGLAVTTDGRALAWGSNGEGRLGIGGGAGSLTPVFVHLPPDITVTQVSGGAAHSLAATSDGHVLAWGSNAQGALGDGTTTHRSSPVYVHLPSGAHITEVSGGWSFSLGLSSDGRALGWGSNGQGRLGDGTGANRLTPVSMVLPQYTVATAISAGSYHSLLLAEPTASRTVLTAHPTHAAPGQEVTLTAQVTCVIVYGSGTVTFMDDNDQVIGTGELGPTGIATLTTTDLAEGQHHITAFYEGDANCPPSTSNTVTVTISTEPAHPSLHLDKHFDGFVSPTDHGTKHTAKHGHRTKHHPRRNARMMSAWREHDMIRYRFVVTNDGDVPISAITIHDSLTGTITCSSDTLEPGQTVTCHAVHKVTSAEKSRGHVDNTATATGTNEDDGTTVISNEAHLRVDVTYA
ncbi:Ig-like domain repeat protein [Spirillospora sp. NPDC052269]